MTRSDAAIIALLSAALWFALVTGLFTVAHYLDGDTAHRSTWEEE